jgi:hypothetical protein
LNTVNHDVDEKTFQFFPQMRKSSSPDGDVNFFCLLQKPFLLRGTQFFWKQKNGFFWKQKNSPSYKEE